MKRSFRVYAISVDGLLQRPIELGTEIEGPSPENFAPSYLNQEAAEAAIAAYLSVADKQFCPAQTLTIVEVYEA